MLLQNVQVLGYESCKAGVGVKKLTDTAKLPERGSQAAGGYDLYADIQENVIIPAHETVKVGTGLAMSLPEDTVGLIFARSGLATKQGLRPANCVGVIDSDYRGEIKVPIYNDSNVNQGLENKERVAQMVIMPYLSVTFNEVEELTESNRDKDGFGSTGTK